MDRILDIAHYMTEEYRRLSGKTLEEAKLHRLLYFAQRESFAVAGEPLFEEMMEGWRHGPVSREVRLCIASNAFDTDQSSELSAQGAYIAKNVLLQYGVLAAAQIREILDGETSWQNARAGLAEDEDGEVRMSLEDIRKDAEKVRPYDAIYDMYYDEFEDAEEDQ